MVVVEASLRSIRTEQPRQQNHCWRESRGDRGPNNPGLPRGGTSSWGSVVGGVGTYRVSATGRSAKVIIWVIHKHSRSHLAHEETGGRGSGSGGGGGGSLAFFLRGRCWTVLQAGRAGSGGGGGASGGASSPGGPGGPPPGGQGPPPY